ncbi:TIGR02147 family protein [Deltaproteobacteria bacterium TL4]
MSVEKLVFLSFEQDLQLDIYRYRDFRTILKIYFEACKDNHVKYSYRYFTKALGLNSPGYIQSILNGKKTLSDRLMREFIQMMGLPQSSRDYFELLVKMERVDFSSSLHHEYYQAAQMLRTKKIKVKTINESQIDCISSWYHWVIREMTLLKGAHLKVQWFRRCLHKLVPLSGKQIIKIIEDLKEAHLLQEQEGTLLTPDPVLNFADESISTLLKMYHRGTLEQGILSLGTKAHEREYGSVLAATTPEKVALVKEKLRKTRREILEMLDAPVGEATELVSFAYQFFPVAQAKEDADE